jgi:SAM-dependent methyltransferase
VSDYLDFQIDFGAPDTVSAYDELPLWSAMTGLLLLEHVELKSDARVLDVGCGTGFPLIELAERLGPASRVCPKAIAALSAHIDHRATVEKLTALFERAGFRLVRVQEARASMRFADGSALLRHYFVKLGFLDGWKGVVEVERRKDVFARLESKLNRASQLRGALDLTIPLAYVEAQPA